MISRFVDRDMVMQYHWGLGVGHVYAHNRRVEIGIPRDRDLERDEQANNQDEDDHHSLSDSLETGEISKAEEVRGLDLFDEQSNMDSESAESADEDAEDDVLDYKN